MRKLVRSLIVAFALSVTFPAIAIAQGTPAATPPPFVEWTDLWDVGEVTRVENTTRIVWNDDVESIDRAIGFVPVSLLFTLYESETYTSTYVFVELRNISGQATHAPNIAIELYQGDFGFGGQRLDREKPWIEPGDSAFYEAADVYANSVGNQDWDGVTMLTGGDPDLVSTEGVQFDRDRLYNDRSTPLPPTQLGVAVFDRNDMFVGTCGGPRTGANTPPGGSLRLSEPADPETAEGCQFTLPVGQHASTELGAGEPFRIEYFVEGFD